MNNPTLPPSKAFRLQFSAKPDVFAGRIEHLASGRTRNFASGEELVEVLQRMLAEATKPQES